MEGKSRLLVLLAICIFACLALPAWADVHYVALSGDNSNGSPWEYAYNSVQDGIYAADSGDEVWVKAGTYNECITLKNGVSLYGGFAGTETARSERDWETNVTTLDGTNGDDSVVTAPYGTTTATVIDGFTITNGVGKLSDIYRYGGGIYCNGASPTISNNKITGNTLAGDRNYGGGILCWSSSSIIRNNEITYNIATGSTVGSGGGIALGYSSATVSGNIIEDNDAREGGGILCYSGCTATITGNAISNNTSITGAGGISCNISSLTITNNLISGNSGTHGGAIGCNSSPAPTIANNVITENSATYGTIFCVSSSPTITNNTLVDNTASNNGGGLYCYSNSSPEVSNNIIASNSSGIYLSSGTPTLNNNCVYGNTSYNYSGLSAGTGDISEDPLFVDELNGDYHLASAESPCVDSGEDDDVDSSWTDMDGGNRQVDILSVSGDVVDIGAYEYVDTTAPSAPVVTDDGAYTASDSTLHFTWAAATDAESGISAYYYAIGSTSGGTDVIDWTEVASSTFDITATDLSLSKGSIYYISVKAENGAELVGIAGVSDGITVDTTAPSVPSVMDDGVYTTTTTALNATWSPPSDAQSGIVEYRYAIGTSLVASSECLIMSWTSTGTNTCANVSGLNLQSRRTYYFYVKAKNGAGLWSEAGVSDGITIGTAQNLADRDWLSGIGNFEWSPETAWWADYTANSSYDYEANSTWASQYSSSQWRGYNLPSDGDRVGAGWLRHSTSAIDPTNISYNLVSDSVFGGSASGNCQWFALTGNLGSYAATTLETRGYIYVDNDDPYALHTSDTLTFFVNRIMMADYSNLPSGTYVAYKLRICFLPSYTTSYVALTASSTEFSAGITVSSIPEGTTAIVPYVQIQGGGDLGTKTPGIYVDGAHLYASRNGSRVQVETPVRIDRKIKTFTGGCYSGMADSYYLSKKSDWVQMSESYSWIADEMRYLRPSNSDIKVLLYESSNCTDGRDSSGLDAWYNNSPLKFSDVLANHTDWLYSDGNGSYYSNRVYTNEYYTHFEDADFQSAWADATQTLLQRHHFDGLFVDTCGLTMNYGATREAWECQSFAHSIIPDLKWITWEGESTARRMYTVQNACGINIDSSETPPFGSIMWDPTWTKVSPYNTSDYSDNSIETTFGGHFNEACFYHYYFDGLQNHYDSAYWKKCLNDMDTIKNWNASISDEADKKWMYCYLEGADIDNGPAYGNNGWIQFGMCSYLLGQNDWTALGVGNDLRPDFDITYDYTTAADDYYEIGSNEYFCSRKYYGDDNGARGGVVVTNADTTGSHCFTPDTDLIDENGDFHPCGTTITIGTDNGRMFFNPSSYKCISAITAPLQDEELTNSIYTITGIVNANRTSQVYPSIAQIRIDGGSWIDCSVNSSTGEFSYNWSGITAGSHTIESRAYFGSDDNEPLKTVRTCSR